MLIISLGLLLALISFGCSIFILVHAFQRSVGTGVMVLCIPCFMIYYAFSQFEHPRKNLILAGFFGCSVLAAVFLGLGANTLSRVMMGLPPEY